MRQVAIIILLAIIAINMVITWKRNGQEKPKYLQTYDLRMPLIALAIQLALYYCAGLFDCLTE